MAGARLPPKPAHGGPVNPPLTPRGPGRGRGELRGARREGRVERDEVFVGSGEPPGRGPVTCEADLDAGAVPPRPGVRHRAQINRRPLATPCGPCLSPQRALREPFSAVNTEPNAEPEPLPSAAARPPASARPGPAAERALEPPPPRPAPAGGGVTSARTAWRRRGAAILGRSEGGGGGATLGGRGERPLARCGGGVWRGKWAEMGEWRRN